ncbi:PAS domain-containing sensor histidine kinase [Halomonas sp. NO4]|uniref:sensor histidine kinase n=1 Tax=Halomonas sp. NO4 TaxID=2484813 RepID=UPI0013D022AD|nr:PAS domain-containing sensor histidine kinase [Halomonas sp. NO4]
MIQVDPQGRIRDFNHAADGLLGRLAVDERLGERLDVQGVSRLVAILAAPQGAPGAFAEFEACIGDRHFRFAVGPTSPVDEQRVIQLTEITKCRALFQQLKTSEQCYHSLFLEHPDAVYSLGLDGRFLEVNRRTCELTGYRYEQLLGEHWEAVVVEKDREAVRHHFRQVLGGQSCSYRCRVLDRTIGERVAQVTNVPMIVDGEVVGVFGIAQDGTELYQSRQTLRRLYSAQENIREEERRRIARDLHDDLGQMLTAMKLDLERVNHELPGLPSDHVERLREKGHFIDEVIEKVRDIAANLRPSILDDLGFEAAAEWFLEQCARRDQLDIRWQPGSGVTGQAVGETATVLFRILQECLTNIRRHARASRVIVRYDEHDDRACLEVRDDGIGFIPQATQERGVGLTGMRERVAMLGGSLRVESSPGMGTRIGITLPLEPGHHD